MDWKHSSKINEWNATVAIGSFIRTRIRVSTDGVSAQGRWIAVINGFRAANPKDGSDFFETAEEAKEAAEKAIKDAAYAFSQTP